MKVITIRGNQLIAAIKPTMITITCAEAERNEKVITRATRYTFCLAFENQVLKSKSAKKQENFHNRTSLEATCRKSAHFHQLRNGIHLSDCSFYGIPEEIQTCMSENLLYHLDASPQSTKFPLQHKKLIDPCLNSWKSVMKKILNHYWCLSYWHNNPKYHQMVSHHISSTTRSSILYLTSAGHG